jgi:uncharacterized protein YxeA
MKKGGIKIIISIIVLVIVFIIGGYFIFSNYFSEPQKIKVDSLKITNVYRDCTKNSDGNFRDITVQTTVDINVKKTRKNSIKLSAEDCTLKIGPNKIGGFALNKIPTPEPYVDGIEDSGLHMITGGELRGDISDTLTFCCQKKCDVTNLNICS